MTKTLADTFLNLGRMKGEHQGVIPHLTVADGDAADADEAADELRLRLE